VVHRRRNVGFGLKKRSRRLLFGADFAQNSAISHPRERRYTCGQIFERLFVFSRSERWWKTTELEYRWDICRVTKVARIEHLQNHEK
jgi:hypothetical protein